MTLPPSIITGIRFAGHFFTKDPMPEKDVNIGGGTSIRAVSVNRLDKAEILKLFYGPDRLSASNTHFITESRVCWIGLAVLPGILAEPAENQFCGC
jgi:hypothetical protein